MKGILRLAVLIIGFLAGALLSRIRKPKNTLV
jgi:hypothetical protein